MKSEVLSRRALNRALLARQMLLARADISARGCVDRLVGQQAQQAQPPFVGLWTRVAGFQRADLLDLLRRREVVRSTLMRGTLHYMGVDDYVALRATLQPMLSAGFQAVLRARVNGLDVPAVVKVGQQSFVEQPKTFTALRAVLLDAFPGGDERALGYAVRMHLPLVAVPDDSGWGFPSDPVFADAATWLGKAPASEEQTETLVLRYLAAFGPAAAADVQVWSGLNGLKSVLDTLRPRLQVYRDERKRELFDLPDAPRPGEDAAAPVRFVPGFDNVILAHADRTRIIADEHRPRVTTKNLLVLPTFLVDGFVAGTWKSSRAKAAATLTLSPFAPLKAATKAELTAEGDPLLRFLEPDASKFAVRFEAP